MLVTILLVFFTISVYFHDGEEFYKEKCFGSGPSSVLPILAMWYLKPTTLSLRPIHHHPVYTSQFTALQTILILCFYLYFGVENVCRHQVF